MTRHRPTCGSRITPRISSATPSVDHRLDQDRLAEPRHARGRGLDRGRVAQVQRHRAQLALVRESGTDGLDHDRIAQRLRPRATASAAVATSRPPGCARPNAGQELLAPPLVQRDDRAPGHWHAAAAARAAAPACAAPMSAAASPAAIASSMPSSGTMPAAISASATGSGRHSGKVASTAARPPVASRAASQASSETCQSASLQRSVARQVEHEAGEVPAAGHDGGEGGAQALGLAPDEDVVVERVGDRDEVAERRAHRLAPAPA